MRSVWHVSQLFPKVYFLKLNLDCSLLPSLHGFYPNIYMHTNIYYIQRCMPSQKDKQATISIISILHGCCSLYKPHEMNKLDLKNLRKSTQVQSILSKIIQCTGIGDVTTEINAWDKYLEAQNICASDKFDLQS